MENKQRHGCVTAWLIFMIIANSLSALMYLLAGDFLLENLPIELTSGTMILLGVFGLLNIAFAVLLLKWKKIGFYGFVVSAIAILGINLSAGLPVGQSLAGLVGIIILWAVLQIKQNEVSAWKNLE